MFVLLITSNLSLKLVILLITGNSSLRSVVLLITGNLSLRSVVSLITGNHSSVHATSSHNLKGGGIGAVVAWMSWAIVCSLRLLEVTGNTSLLWGYYRLKISEEKLVEIKCCLVSNKVKLKMVQSTKCGLPNALCVRKTDFRPLAGFWLHCKDRTNSDTFCLSCTSSYILYHSYKPVLF